MLFKQDIYKAMKEVSTGRKGRRGRPSQLAQSLQIYKDRGEFTGEFFSAVDCLLQAGYEIHFLVTEEAESVKKSLIKAADRMLKVLQAIDKNVEKLKKVDVLYGDAHQNFFDFDGDKITDRLAKQITKDKKRWEGVA